MTVALEQIVRPFEAPLSIVQGRVVTSSRKQPLEVARVIWGTAGTVSPAVEEKVPEPGGFTLTVKDCDDTWTESGRQTTDQRIENPDDPAQYVMVRRIDKIDFKRPDKQDPTFSYSGYAVQQAMEEFNAAFNSGTTKKDCTASFALKWE